MAERDLRGAASGPASPLAAEGDAELRPRPPETLVPLSAAQERMWVLEQFQDGAGAYNCPLALRFKGPLDVVALQQALRWMAERHEVLRARFPLVEGQPRVEFAAGGLDVLPVEDLSALPSEEREKSALAALEREARRPFDLAAEVSFRARLWCLAQDDWLLLLNQHHIISDEWSRLVQMRELGDCYRAALTPRARPPELPPALQYGDYALWEQSRQRGAREAELLAYWQTCLGDPSAGAMLLPDFPRPPLQTFAGARAEVVLTSETEVRVRELARRQRASLFMTLLAAWKLLVARTTGEPLVRVGTPVAGRERPELEGTVGMFVNTIVLQTPVVLSRSFRDLIDEVRNTVLDALAHQDAPFERLVDVLQVRRDLSRNPLFQVMFQVRNFAPAVLDFGPLEARLVPVWTGTAKFDLTCEFTSCPDGLRCVLEFNRDLYAESTAQRLLDHFQTLLAAALDQPDRPLEELPWISAADLAWLTDKNATAADYPPYQTVPEMFAVQAARTPGNIAVAAEDQVLTYGELSAAANQVARFLRSRGVGRETLVGVFFDRSALLPVALLGILKAGAAYVPLDPAYPAARLRSMLKDSAATVVVTRDSLRGELPETSAEVIALDAQRADWNSLPTTELDISPDPGDRAYVIYTSGSTGEPKGVEVAHRGVVNFLASMARTPGCGSADVVAAVTTLSFDIHVLELFLPLSVGGQVLLVPRAQATDGPTLAALIERHQATLLQATPATWRLLIESGWSGNSRLKAICGGEALPADLAEALLPRVGELWNLYGPTETTVWSTVYRVRDVPTGTVPIGLPIANTRVHVLDSRLQPTPVGVPGELWIAGDGLALGYLGRAELTATRFLPELGRPTGGRMYRTGDLALWGRDGALEYLGRVDQQVKIRGFRVELGEIEAALATCEGVAQVAAAVRTWSLGDQRLVAYFVPQAGALPTASQLRSHLRERLPDYMLPAAFVPLATLPLTPSGKVDRGALPEPPPSVASAADEYVPPQTATEQELARLWTEVLGIQRVGLHDNFFELGGHSLLAVRLFARVAEKFGRTLPLATLFTAPTVSELACRLTTTSVPTASSTLVPIRASGSLPPLFCLTGLGALTFEPLARWLGPEQPVYAFQAPGYEGDETPLASVEELAERHLIDLRRAVPHGPYVLGGHCFGGVVAFEMARRLVAAGEEVPLLVLFDAWRPVAQPRWLARLLRRGWARRVKLHVDALGQRPPREQIAYLAGMGRAFLERRLNRSRLSRRRQGLESAAHARIAQSNFRAQLSYRPGSFAGPAVHFIQSARPIISPRDRRARWNESITGGIELISVPGRHVGMLRDSDHARVIAEHLRSRLSALVRD
jgi:amino acid adenylation domain-containing protein